MKNVFLIALISIASQLHAQTILFNDQWRFYKGNIAAGEKIATADASWRTIDLPHDWSIEGPFSNEWASGTGYLPTGIGWYRKNFTLLPEQQGKSIYIYFDGVYKNSEVWINEHPLGKRPNGYTSFYYDITQYLNVKGKNLIAVKVDHTDFGDSRWYSGSGINRNVYLMAVEPVHIAVWGTTFTTPQVSAAQAGAELLVSVRNKTAKQANVKISADLVNAAGKVVAHAEQPGVIPAGADGQVKLGFSLNKPELWSVDHPVLYTLRTRLETNGKKSGQAEERVGFRAFHFDPDHGFFLNDENVKLKGVCFHDDAGALGSAVPKAVWRRRLETLKELGCNSIRMSHNPHQDYLYDLCDEMGFLVQDEAFDEWAIPKNKWVKGWNVGTPSKDGYSKYFAEWAERDLQDMIRRSRNHVSIIMWSIGNEIDYPNDPYTHEVLNTGRNPQIYGRGYQPGNPPASEMAVIAKRLVAVVRKEDVTRPVTAALAGVVMSNLTEYPDALDLVGYNYQEYRYPDDHAKYSRRVIYGSENGKAYEAWAPVEELEYISAQYLWTAFDFIGEAHSWPSRSSGAGVIDLAGFPKPEFYYRKSLWSSAPVTHLAVTPIPRPNERRRPVLQSHWNWTEGDSVRVLCYTNADEAELFLNGKSLGRKSRKDAPQKVIEWNTVYQPGTLEVKTSGKTTGNYSLTTAGVANALSIKSDHTTLKADKDDVIHITVNVVDNKNLRLPEADQEVTITIDGPGRLIGLESGDLASHEDYKANKRKVYKGKLLAYIQAIAPGAIKVSIASPGLPSQTIQLTATRP
jgi:beta-galactosidase/beta-glucuronidase